MIAEMQKKQEDDKAGVVIEAETRADELRKKREEIEKAQEEMRKTEEGKNTNDWDWTKTYSSWDRWEDPDLLREKEEKERAKAERAATRQGYGCRHHDRSAERKLMDMTTMEKIKACQEFNAQGNAFFEEGQYGRAALRYYKTLVYVEYVFPDTDEEDNLLEHVRFIANLNSAACKLKTRQYDEIKQHCAQALAFEPENTKAYYRRAVLNRIKDDFENAKADIKKALELSPNDFEVRREYCRLRSKMETYERRSKEIYQRMLKSKECKVGGTGKDDTHAQTATSVSATPSDSSKEDEDTGDSEMDFLSRMEDEEDALLDFLNPVDGIYGGLEVTEKKKASARLENDFKQVRPTQKSSVKQIT